VAQFSSSETHSSNIIQSLGNWQKLVTGVGGVRESKESK
jgi:hypothetical protein